MKLLLFLEIAAIQLLSHLLKVDSYMECASLFSLSKKTMRAVGRLGIAASEVLRDAEVISLYSDILRDLKKIHDDLMITSISVVSREVAVSADRFQSTGMNTFLNLFCT